MKKLLKRFAAAAMAVALVAGLTACESGGGISKFDASVYVKGLLDQCYRGEYDSEFLDLMDMTQNEADETYLSNLEVDAANFADYYMIYNLTDEVEGQITDLFQQMYDKVAYTVKPAVKTDSGFSVEIAVTPIDVYTLVDEGYNDMVDQFYADYYAQTGLDIYNMSNEEFSALGEDGQNAYDYAWAQAVITYFSAKLAESQPLEEETLLVQVKQDSEGMWEIPEKDWNNIDTYFNYAFRY